jgi:transcriptional regulator with XRE-family HTH domain
MNPVVEELNELMHIGVKRRSGRYPWGSGEDPYQHGRDLLGRIEELKKQGWTETAENVKKEFGEDMTLTRYREEKSRARVERRMLNVETAKRLKEKEGLGETEIGRRMGVNESTVRSWLNAESEARMRQTQKTADFLRDQVDSKKMIDVSSGVEIELGISKEKLNQALSVLKEEGYAVYTNRFEQVTNKGQWTTQKVLCAPGIPYSSAYDLDQVKTITEYHSKDGGQTFNAFRYPESLDSKRMRVRYADEAGPDGITGVEKDGIVEIRRGVKDLSLGNSHYSQVRIMVDGTHYIKGMAVYSDNLPDGVDVMFNTNKAAGTPLTKVLKEIKNDPDNPFGSLIMPKGQSTYIDSDGKEKLSLINKRADEGDWSDWKDALPSQFLSKQPISLIKKQLSLATADKVAEYDEICSLTNPTVKKHLLSKFADSCDSAAVHLQAAAFPNQKYHVIIPVNTLKDNEVYAPNYNDGDKLALIRYPHGGIFEIPILTVNNKHKPARDLIGSDSIDAVGINKKNADRLSGADFDGDTVMCIRTQKADGTVQARIKNAPELDRLKGFDPKESYPEVPGMVYMTKKGTQREMGVISNLITDMTLAGAGPDDLANAVRHSMVVIDAHKHKLNYKQSELDHNIASLKQRYQTRIDPDGTVHTGGATTIISKSKGEARVPKRQGSPHVNIKGAKWYDPNKPEGSLVYTVAEDAYYPTRKYNKDTGEMTIATTKGKVVYNVSDPVAREYYEPVKRVNERTGKVEYTNQDGTLMYKVKTRTQNSTKMAETDDAYSLVSNMANPKETEYANYANAMKALANKARMEVVSTGKIEYSSSAKVAYQAEVDSLLDKLNTAKLNAPRERQAQRMANAEIKSKLDAGILDKEDVKKESQRALDKYRKQVGSVARRDRSIDITDREWAAIQAGAISEARLKDILNNTDVDSLRERATPRSTKEISPSNVSRIKAMRASGYTNAQIAEKLGISPSAVSKYAKGGN